MAPVVLNVNDDRATRYFTTRILREAGFAVEEASSGAEALESVRRRPNLVILDVKLPDINGLEVCRRLKADPDTADIPVLQTSASAVSTEGKVAGLESGADAYLPQPFEPPELIATARALIRAQKAEREVREIGRDWQNTFDVIADGVALLGSDLHFIRCNQAMARYCGQAASALTGHPLSTCPPVHGERLAEVVRGALTRKERVVSEALIGPQLLRIVADPMIGPDGDVERVVLIVADITAHRQLEEDHRRRADELAESARRKDEFLGMLAHELRNPLHALSATLSLMERVDGQDERSQRLRHAARRQTRQLARLVDDLLEVSRITRGKVQLQRETCDLVRTLWSAIEHAKPLVDTRNQRLRATLPDAPLPIEGDPLRLEQVFVNLLQNASKYSELGTEIDVDCQVDTTRTPGQVTIRVTDQGIGIPRERLTDIFQPFVQVDQSLARSLGGLGIGLTIARTFVELHGGSITADSDGAGCGATFTIVLPLGVTTPLLAPVPPDARNHWQASTPRVILLVEDNNDAREMLGSWLAELGHRVYAVATGAEGIRIGRQTRPDIVLLDVGLPGMNGYEVAQALRDMPETREALIVAISGYGRPEDSARAREAGCDAHVVKPIQPELLARLAYVPRHHAVAMLNEQRTRT